MSRERCAFHLMPVHVPAMSSLEGPAVHLPGSAVAAEFELSSAVWPGRPSATELGS
jgi:hypothetical protein